jgi:multidrug efflux pump subunit AcrA (membrane-fusion protein)
MSMVVDALKNVVRTFVSLFLVGLIIYGGIYLINKNKNDNAVIVDNDQNQEEVDEDKLDETVEDDIEVDYETITYKDPVVKTVAKSGFSRTGIVSLNDKVEIGSDLSSNVESIEVGPGDSVKKGDVLFKLQENTATKQLAINLSSAEKQLANAYKALELTKVNANLSENSYQIQVLSADLALEQAILSLESSRDLAARQLGLEDMGKEVETIGNEISQNSPSVEKTLNGLVMQGLSEFTESDLSNQYDFEEAQERLSEAQENLEYGQRKLTNAQNYYSDIGKLQQIENAKLQMSSLRNQIATQRVATDLNINQMMSQINQAETQVQLAKVQIDQTVVTAPVDGTVLSVDLTKGEKVSPGVNYITMTSALQKQVEVFVSIDQAQKLSNNQIVEIVYAGDKYEGKINEIALLADERSRLIKVKIGGIVGSEGLIANAFAKVNFSDLGQVDDQLIAATAVPFKILKIENNKYLAPVWMDGKIEYKKVEVSGPIMAGKVNLIGGLNEGDEIVVGGNESLITMK